MILNILTEEKFTDYAISQFSAPELQSDFVLIPSNHANWQVNQIDKCTVIQQRSKEFEELLNRLDQYTGIIFHGMHWGGWQSQILQRLPEHVKAAWYFWGGEIYSRSDVHINQFAPITKFVVKVRDFKKFFTKTKKNTDWELPYELYKRIDYCLTGEQEEYEFAKAFLQNDMKFIWYTCYDIDAMLGSLKDASCNGNNVIVGNSATAECNYFDVIPRIRKYLKKNQRVVLPLSYGDPWVMNAVNKYAKFFLGNAAMPLLDFLPREEYNRILQSCSTMIMDQYTPQAQGNILTGLWLGMRVYMSEKSIAFKFFKRLGFKVFSFESEFKKYGLTSLPQEDVTVNRKLMVEWYSKEHVMQSAKNVVEILEGK